MGERTIRVVLFQIGWWSCVSGAANDHEWIGLTTAVTLISAHFCWSQHRIADLSLLVATLILGALFDITASFPAGIEFRGRWLLFSTLPLWMLCLWGMFAAVLRPVATLFGERYRLAAAVGAVAGPLSYFAAERMGAISFEAGSTRALPIIALEWAAATPIMIAMVQMIEPAAFIKDCAAVESQSRSKPDAR